MFACAREERRVRAAEPREDWRDEDEVYCALVELRELFTGGCTARQILFQRWLDVAYWRLSPAVVAKAARSRRTGEPLTVGQVRRQVRQVAKALRGHYGPAVGNRVEQVLGFG